MLLWVVIILYQKKMNKQPTMEEKIRVEWIITQVANWLFSKYHVDMSADTYIKIQNLLIKEINEKTRRNTK